MLPTNKKNYEIGTKNPDRGSLIPKALPPSASINARRQLKKSNLKLHAFEHLKKLIDEKYTKDFLKKYNTDPKQKAIVMNNLLKIDKDLSNNYNQAVDGIMKKIQYNESVKLVYQPKMRKINEQN